MITKFLVLLLAALSWVATLWLLIRPDFSRWPEPGIILVHAAPPLAAWLAWVWLLRRLRIRKDAEAKARVEQEQAERNAALEEAHKKQEAEMRQRRFACDCRAIAISCLSPQLDTPIAGTALPHVDIDHREAGDPDGAAGAILDTLTPSIADALSKIYLACRASAVFPIYVAPPSEASGEEVLAKVRSIHAELIDTLDTGMGPSTCSPSILFLPVRDCAANSVLSLFESAPDLPGAIVLAFDSPRSRRIAGDGFDDERTPEQVKRVQQSGHPAEGVIAMLLTHVELPSMLVAVDTIDAGERDAMTPFWESSLQPGGHLAMLVAANDDARSELALMPVLGRIHRASSQQASPRHTGVLALTRLVQGTLERAQVNAGLIDPPFSVEGAPKGALKKNAEDSNQAPRCSWIIHNAGSVELAGKRLAALGSALYYFGIDLSPVDMASSMNVVTRIGDLGQAAPVGQLALGVAEAARQTGPVLCAEYSGDDGIAMSFIRQVRAS